ncbi:MAG: hypothetical protein KC643_33005 [Nitrospira sp.]|nr:hypothetical protein [Nitrospira sp.]
MNVAQILNLVGPVRKSGRGWMAKCPAHQDRRPSLSISEGEDRVLLHCFAGCDIQAVCGAIGIEIRNLFAGNVSHWEWLRLQQARWIKQQEEQKRQIEQGRVIEGCREAEALLRTTHGQDLSQWNDKKCNRVIDAVGQALGLLRDEDEEHFYVHIGRTA